MDTRQLIYRMALATVPGMTLDLGRQLLDVVGGEEAFFSMPEKELVELVGASNRIFSRAERDACLRRAEQELAFIEKGNIAPVYFTDARYPQRLLEINDAPLLVYTLGDCDMNVPHVVSIVGTRHATPAGVKFCDTLVGDLKALVPDVIVVSGLAYGIDIASHRAALAHGAPTVAVMARGLNRIYPAVHRRDAIEIVKRGGLLLTDYTSQDEMHKGNFLARNRIIAALADVTVVVESASHGGSLVTASLAMSYNRDVMAVPGRVNDEFSRGCNKLIASNRAALITGAEQLVENMRWEVSERPVAAPKSLFDNLTPDEQAVIDFLRTTDAPCYLNDIARQLGQPVYVVTSMLVEMDFKGLVVSHPGGRYAPA